MHDFRKLKVWQTSHRLALQTYAIVAKFPRDERYGLSSQIKRACSSIGANIAEGCGRGSNADMARFLLIAGGSACELESHMLLARALEFLDDPACEQVMSDIAEVKRMLESLAKKLRNG